MHTHKHVHTHTFTHTHVHTHTHISIQAGTQTGRNNATSIASCQTTILGWAEKWDGETQSSCQWCVIKMCIVYVVVVLNCLRAKIFCLPEGPRGLTFTLWRCCRLCLWHKPTKLAHSFLFCSCVCFCLYGPFNCISFHKFSWQLSAFSLCSSGLISALLVLSTIYLFMKVSLSPDIILCG